MLCDLLANRSRKAQCVDIEKEPKQMCSGDSNPGVPVRGPGEDTELLLHLL
jgi:hypothetical protein